jgi:hypothetical protein
MPMLAIAAAAGAASAAFYAALLSGAFGALILAYLAQLPLFVVGLWLGFAGAAIAGLAAMVALAVAGGLIFALVYAVANAAPVVAVSFAAQLNRTGPDGNTEWYPPGHIIGLLLGTAMTAFLLMNLLLAGEAGGAENVVRGFVDSALSQLVPPGSTAPENMAAFASLIARFFPGVIAGSWIVMVIANAVLAQGLLARFGRNLRPSPSMAQIELPSWVTGATVIAAIGSFMPGISGFIGGNLVLMSMLAYAFAGLAVVHALTARSSNRTVALVATYTFLFIFGWPLIIVALVGAAEPWLNLRRRFGGTGT